MASIQLDLNEEELRDIARQLNNTADSLEADDDEFDLILTQINRASVLAEQVLEWVAQAKGTLARQGLAA